MDAKTRQYISKLIKENTLNREALDKLSEAYLKRMKQCIIFAEEVRRLEAIEDSLIFNINNLREILKLPELKKVAAENIEKLALKNQKETQKYFDENFLKKNGLKW